MCRQRSMLIPCQVPSSALIAKGGATFVPMTSSRVSEGPGVRASVRARACGSLGEHRHQGYSHDNGANSGQCAPFLAFHAGMTVSKIG
jgi:hypothetical protein